MATYLSPRITPTVTAGGYVQNDCVGGVITVDNAPPSGTIMSIVIIDDADQGPSMEMYFFESEPDGVADRTTFTLSDDDAGKCVGVVAVDTWFDGVNNRTLVVDNIGMPYSHKGGNLYLMLKTVDLSSPTFAATDDLHIRLGVVY